MGIFLRAWRYAGCTDQHLVVPPRCDRVASDRVEQVDMYLVGGTWVHIVGLHSGYQYMVHIGVSSSRTALALRRPSSGQGGPPHGLVLACLKRLGLGA